MSHGIDRPGRPTAFLVLWTGQALSLVGSAAVQFALIWWLTRQTGSAAVLATAALVGLLPTVALGPLIGALVDRWDRKAVMLAADAMVALASAFLAYAFFAETVSAGLAFVILFTAWPFLQMVWISLNDWSLITPPTYVGFQNYLNAFADSQFWVSLLFTLKYTLYLTPILMIGGYLISLLVTPNSGLSRLTRTFVFIPVVIGLVLAYGVYDTFFKKN